MFLALCSRGDLPDGFRRLHRLLDRASVLVEQESVCVRRAGGDRALAAAQYMLPLLHGRRYASGEPTTGKRPK